MKLINTHHPKQELLSRILPNSVQTSVIVSNKLLYQQIDISVTAYKYEIKSSPLSKR